MNIGSPFVTDAQAPNLTEPGQSALDDPAVPSHAGLWLDANPGNAAGDAARAQRLPTARVVVPLVGMHRGGSAASSSTRLADARDCTTQVLEHYAAVEVGPRQADRQRNARAIDDQMPFGAGFAAVGRVGAGRHAPLFAGIRAASTLARLQSICPASPSRSRGVWCSTSHTPASCQPRSRRQ